MANRNKQTFVVGRWLKKIVDDKEQLIFVPLELQPDDAISDLNKMLVWARTALKGEPGTYDFVREVPGSFVCEKTEHVVTRFR